MSAKGTFEISLTPQEDEGFAAGRLLINKTYQGDMEGEGLGQMISKRVENGTAIYYAIEEFTGSLMGKTGSFTLSHQGFMDKETQSLEVTIVQGSGSDELEGISGSMAIIRSEDGHSYELRYEL